MSPGWDVTWVGCIILNDLFLQSEIHHSAGISLMWNIPLRWDVSTHISSPLLRERCDHPKRLNFKKYIRKSFSQVKAVVEKISKFLGPVAFQTRFMVPVKYYHETIVNSQKQSVIKVISMTCLTMSYIRLCSWFRVYGSLSRKYVELNHRMVIIARLSNTLRGLNNKKENDI